MAESLQCSAYRPLMHGVSLTCDNMALGIILMIWNVGKEARRPNSIRCKPVADAKYYDAISRFGQATDASGQT